jgi:pantoate--beta-alanine ligase
MTKVIKKISGWEKIRDNKEFSKKSLGFVPTMGALHKGHIALIKRSLKQNDVTVVSIFVNPTQFSNKEDFQNYPNTFESDLKTLEKLNVDYLLNPKYNKIYPDEYSYKVIESKFSKKLCGQFRKGHFDGVLTVILKLLNIVRPDRIYFGEKDFQQLELVKRMIKAFFINTKVIAVKTVRDSNGLALSSRNCRLNKKELKKASEFPRILNLNLPLEDIKFLLEEVGFRVEYVEQIGKRRFGAVYINNIRLIDNVRV